ncbi:hypothetical protein AAAC51_29745 [Priestia megaterium]
MSSFNYFDEKLRANKRQSHKGKDEKIKKDSAKVVFEKFPELKEMHVIG